MDTLPGLAAELVGAKADVIVTWLTPAVRAAKQATSQIPIVMAGAGDPVATGVVASLVRPGGNITGMAGVTAELAGKNVELIREMLPSAKRLAVLCNAVDSFTKPFLAQIEGAASGVGFELDRIMVNGNDELETSFPRMNKDGVDAVIVQPSLPTKRAAELAPAGPSSRRVADRRFRQRRRPDFLCRPLFGSVPAGRRVCRQDSEGKQAGRSTRSVTDPIRPEDQPQDRKGDRNYGAADHARASRRGDRIELPICARLSPATPA